MSNWDFRENTVLIMNNLGKRRIFPQYVLENLSGYLNFLAAGGFGPEELAYLGILACNMGYQPVADFPL